jgi:hypothetical protein
LISNEDTYTFTLTGALALGATSSVTFTLLVDKICSQATISLPALPPTIPYTVTNPAEIAYLTAMITSNVICLIDYSLTKPDGSALPSALISMFTTSSRELTIYSTDNSFAGMQIFSLNGKLRDGTASNKYPVEINVIH